MARPDCRQPGPDGDRAVLPILQHFCDDAKRRQKFGCGWTHWGRGISPGYVASGLLFLACVLAWSKAGGKKLKAWPFAALLGAFVVGWPFTPSARRRSA